MKRIHQGLLAGALLCAGVVGIGRAQEQVPAVPMQRMQPQPTPEMQQARAPSLKPGDPAPDLAGGKWLKGDPVSKLEKDKIYVVEFWATWCGPCVAAIPHVSEMQAKYGKDGVTFIGQNVWEHDTDKVEPFVQQQGDKMSYRVRMDDTADGGKGKMAETWMEAAGQDGIPCSFLIGKDGKIAWIGHPMELEPILKQVIAGTFDPAKAEADKKELEQSGHDLEKAMKSGDFDGALKILDKVEAKQPELADQLSYLRFNINLQKKDYDAAYKAAAKFGTAMNDNPQALNDLAWTIVAAEGLEKRDLDLADKFASRAVELTERKDASVLDTLARAKFEKGDLDKAIEIETEALSKADTDSRADVRETLDKYKKAKTDGGGAKTQ